MSKAERTRWTELLELEGMLSQLGVSNEIKCGDRDVRSSARIYYSENGDKWYLCLGDDSRVFVLHKANVSWGGNGDEDRAFRISRKRQIECRTSSARRPDRQSRRWGLTATRKRSRDLTDGGRLRRASCNEK